MPGFFPGYSFVAFVDPAVRCELPHFIEIVQNSQNAEFIFALLYDPAIDMQKFRCVCIQMEHCDIVVFLIIDDLEISSSRFRKCPRVDDAFDILCVRILQQVYVCPVPSAFFPASFNRR